MRGIIRPTNASPIAVFRCFHISALDMANGDLNNVTVERARRELEVDPAYHKQSFAIPEYQDDAEIRRKYRPFLLDEETSKSDWISQLELSTVLKMVKDQGLSSGQDRLRVLVLHGSMRNR